ncbi:MAG: hypothetical protein ACI4RF_08160 [Eubacterium sp.]
MKLTFKMTGEEYYSAWKYKRKKGMLNQHLALKSIILAVIIIVFSVIFKIEYFAYILAGMLIITGFLGSNMEKKSVINEFRISPIQSGEHTIRIYDEGIELINSYEKMFVPWQSIFAVKETPANIQILPTFRKGIAVISKERYGGSELEQIIKAVKSHVKVEEGKK